jgi:hypothetical protein
MTKKRRTDSYGTFLSEANDKKWRYVCAALLGFAEEQQIQQIPLIEFIKMPENQVTYTIQHDKKE